MKKTRILIGGLIVRFGKWMLPRENITVEPEPLDFVESYEKQNNG